MKRCAKCGIQVQTPHVVQIGKSYVPVCKLCKLLIEAENREREHGKPKADEKYGSTDIR